MDSFGGCLVMLFLILLFALIFGAITMLLWNWLMPYLFGLPEISIYMAIGINFLAGLLFGRFRSSKD